MNNTFNNSSDENFNTAMKMSGEEYDYETLIGFLNSDDVEKQIAVLKLTEIKSIEDASLLVSNMVGQDGKIREVVAFKVNELIKNPAYTNYFLNKKNYDIFLKAIMDINGNVCRQIIEAVVSLKSNQDFCKYFCPKLVETLADIFDEIENLDLSAKQYVVSKRNFQLYWCLDVLYDFAELIPLEHIKTLILKCGNFYDYTIREKIAKILSINLYYNDSEIDALKEKLKNDENYYVRRY